MGKKAWAILAVVLVAVSCSSDSDDPPTTTTQQPAASIDDLSAEFDAWVAEQLPMENIEPFIKTVVAQINDTPDEAPCFTNDAASSDCIAEWGKALTEWGEDCNPPRNAANVTCPGVSATADNSQDAVSKLGTASEQLKPYDYNLSVLIAGTAQDVKYEADHGANYSRPCEAIQHYGATVLSEGGENGVPEDVAIAVDELLFDAYEDIGCASNDSVGATPVTPTDKLIAASNKIEQAHEGIGNIIHHDDGNWDNNGCGVKCGEALGDAIEKTTEAHDDLGSDILSLYTWDKNQTVAHAFDAALYWLKATAPVDDETHHAEYQLGILRDVLRNQVKARQHPALRGEAVRNATPEFVIKDAYNKVEQAHEGIGNVIKNDISGDETCGDRCYAAMQDARKKNNEAFHELGDDILDITTWDKGQTVRHAFSSADYWLGELEQVYDVDLGKHAEYQLGILRDVLAAASKKGNTDG